MASNITQDRMSALTLEQLNQQEVLRLAPLIVYLSTISVTGAIGNILVLYIYVTQFKRSNSKYFILCLACIDLFSSIISHPFEIKTVLHQLTFTSGVTCKVSRFVNSVPTVTSGFIFLVIAIDRYRKVCRPFGWQMSSRVAKYVCVGTIFCGVIFSWPMLLLYGLRSFPVPELRENATECSVNDSFKGTMYPFIYSSTLGFLFIVGSSSLVIMFTLIGRQIHRHSEEMAKHCHPVELKATNALDFEHTEDESSFRDSSMTGNGKCVEGRSTRESTTDDLSKLKHINEDEKIVDIVSGNGCTGSQFPEEASDHGNEIATSDDVVILDLKDAKQNGGLNGTPYGVTIEEPEVNAQPLVNEPRKSAVRMQSAEDQNKGDNRPAKKPGFFRKISNLGTFISSSGSSYDVDEVRQSCQFNTRGVSRIREKRARRISFLMFLISLAYILSYLPHVVLMITRVIKKDFVSSMSLGQRAAYKFFLRSYALNSAVNPFIYSACDKRFRIACRKMYRRFWSNRSRY